MNLKEENALKNYENHVKTHGCLDYIVAMENFRTKIFIVPK